MSSVFTAMSTVTPPPSLTVKVPAVRTKGGDQYLFIRGGSEHF